MLGQLKYPPAVLISHPCLWSESFLAGRRPPSLLLKMFKTGVVNGASPLPKFPLWLQHNGCMEFDAEVHLVIGIDVLIARFVAGTAGGPGGGSPLQQLQQAQPLRLRLSPRCLTARCTTCINSAKILVASVRSFDSLSCHPPRHSESFPVPTDTQEPRSSPMS